MLKPPFLSEVCTALPLKDCHSADLLSSDSKTHTAEHEKTCSSAWRCRPMIPDTPVPGRRIESFRLLRELSKVMLQNK